MASNRLTAIDVVAYLLENSYDEEEHFEDSSDTESEDDVQERNEDSETEQEDSSDEETDEDDSVAGTKYFIGKDKTTKWYKDPFQVSVRTRLFTDDILDTVVTCTNQYINFIKNEYARERDAKLTDAIEICAFIGLLYLAGAYRANRQSLEELWGTEGDGVEKFGLVMNIKRFKFLLRCMRFDDRDTRIARKAEDRLAPIREIFTEFVNNCQKNYSLGEYTTIDEMLAGFRGRCGFRQYIPSKPNKYGIKIYAFVDAKMYYSYGLEIYAGKQPDGPYNISNKPTDVVRRLTACISGSGRNITADNWFTDIDLVQELKEKKLSYVGTLRRNKRQLPTEFSISKGREVLSSVFGFQKDTTLVSYVPKRNKTVILVSTLHVEKGIDPDSGEQKKPSVITFYNATKGGVDTSDQMCATYNVARNIKRWPMVVFFTMLNVAGINSQVIYLGNGLGTVRRRIFLKMLAKELVAGELARRSMKTVGMPLHLQARLKQFRPSNGEQVESEGAGNTAGSMRKRRRCSPCTTDNGRRRLSNNECKKCHIALCMEHAALVCQSCFENEPKE